jgi:hypothetical protein
MTDGNNKLITTGEQLPVVDWGLARDWLLQDFQRELSLARPASAQLLLFSAPQSCHVFFY